MDWTLLIALAVLWLVSPIILLIALIVTRHRLKDARQRLADRPPGRTGRVDVDRPDQVPPPMIGGDRSLAPADLENLLLLRLELQRLLELNALTEERHRQRPMPWMDRGRGICMKVGCNRMTRLATSARRGLEFVGPIAGCSRGRRPGNRSFRTGTCRFRTGTISPGTRPGAKTDPKWPTDRRERFPNRYRYLRFNPGAGAAICHQQFVHSTPAALYKKRTSRSFLARRRFPDDDWRPAAPARWRRRCKPCPVG